MSTIKCKPLARNKVEEQIDKLPTPRLKRIATRNLNTPIRRRRGSDEFARQFPARAVTLDEKVQMKELHKAGLSFRAVEEVYHLVPNQGNGAQRCVRLAAKALRSNARRSSGSESRRMSKVTA